jgi:uncharacterized protein
MKKLLPTELGRQGLLDVLAFATDAGQCADTSPTTQWPRLSELSPAGVAQAHSDVVSWQLRGEVLVRGGQGQAVLHLHAFATLRPVCQRCLQPMTFEADVVRRVRFVSTEQEAAAQDMEEEDDVLSLEAPLDVQAWVEDELLLALPLVPMHDPCPQPLPPPRNPVEDEPEHPFAALAALKRGGHAG